MTVRREIAEPRRETGARSPEDPMRYKPHFVWAVRDELTLRLCGEGVSTCDVLDAGGMRVTTTLDLTLQKIAEKWVKVATIVPHRGNPARAAKALGFDEYLPWMRNLEDKNVRNGALVALDYQTGEVISYVGSAEYYASQSRPEFQPQYDVVGQGFRQPGSAFKPFNYAVGIDEHTFRAGDMLMDVGTYFGGGYSPTDADNLERGPVRVRTALQFSLNIPAVRAMALNAPDHVFARVKDFGMTFQSDTTDAGLALALGVAETRPIDLATAYGTLANGCYTYRTNECTKAGNCFATTGSFRTYATMAHSFRDHGNFLRVNSRYKPAFVYTKDANKFIWTVWKAGYATDPNYFTKVTGLMATYNLYQYDTWK